MLRGSFALISGFLFSVQLYSQPFVYPRNYFRWPVQNKPGIVANFGELREGHWHMGLDIRTDHKVNMPVYAAADGYIARISVSPFGFGKAIYINHPNGLTTLYGHLNKFLPSLDNLVKAQQYKQRSWAIELNFTKDQFPVRKGQFIALSGSTGGSQGPHVHFEVRDTKTGRCINPLFFNLPIPDAVPPVLTKLAIYNRSTTVYDQSAQIIPLTKSKNGYALTKDLLKTEFSEIGFAIGSYDCVSGTTNRNGIYRARIYFDSRPVLQFSLDSLDYNETRFINAHIDYRHHYYSGSYLQQLFRLPGDKGPVYRTEQNDGTITLADTNIHTVRIELNDIRGNSTFLNFKIQYNGNSSPVPGNTGSKIFSPNYVNIFEQNDFELYLNEGCLYDSVQPVFFRFNQEEKSAVSLPFKFCDASIPVHGQFNVRIKPNVAIPKAWENKIVIKRTDGRNTTYSRALWAPAQDDKVGGWLSASFGDFGTFQAFVDDIPPTINDLGATDTLDLSSSSRIVFYPKDNTSLKNFTAELDGRWLMFTNDKGSPWIYSFDDRCPYGLHRLKIRIEDIVGNVTEKEWWFKRHPYSPPKKKKTISKKKKPGRKN